MPRRHDPDDVMNFIVDYKRRHSGIPPSIREISAGCNIPSTSTTKYILLSLQRDGRLQLLERVAARNILIPGEEYTVENHG
jgi:SOS-response transcriptional repressor LexA